VVHGPPACATFTLVALIPAIAAAGANLLIHRDAVPGSGDIHDIA
jgi:hypothetical protein